jgi:hypothetical protein
VGIFLPGTSHFLEGMEEADGASAALVSNTAGPPIVFLMSCLACMQEIMSGKANSWPP